MTGTSKAFKRLGVAGLGAVVFSVGLVPLTELAASAAQGPYLATTATSVSLSPDSDTAANGECNPFTATVTANSSITVNIQQSVPNSTAINTEVIGFCDPSAANPDAGVTYQTPTQQGPGTAGVNTNDNSTGTAAVGTCNNAVATDATHTSNISCDTTYKDTNNDGKILFGVTSNTPGTMPVDAFGDGNANGAHDVNEPGDTSTKTWVVNSQTATTNKVSCTPTSATNPAGTNHKFVCTVTDGSGNALAGQTVHFGVASGPDAGAPSNATCGPTDNGAGGTTAGATPAGSCNYTNNNTPGHDVINVWLDTNGTPGQQAGEPATQITKDWVLPAPQTSFLSLDCSPSESSPASAASSGDSACTEPLTQNNVTLTATVVNGSPAQPVAGVVVQFGNPAGSGTPGGTGADANDTESVSPTTCTTDATGKCTATLTDTSPTNGETLTVLASLPRQNAAADTATSTITYHKTNPAEARNIKVSPATATQNAGGVQGLTATVTDRFGGPVAGVCVAWSESGPGRVTPESALGINCFTQAEDDQGNTVSTNGACLTAANGTCTIEVDSQTTESGAETITASIRTGQTDNGGPAPEAFECNAAAGYSYYTPTGAFNRAGTIPNANGANNVAAGAPAGNCTAGSTVTWKAPTPPPPTTHRVSVNVKLSCFSRHKHRVTCVAQLSKAIAGVTVIFRDAHGNKVGSDVTGSAGKARLHLRGLKSGSHHKYQAHAKRSSKTFAADSRFARVTVL